MKTLAHIQHKWAICVAVCDFTSVSAHALAPMRLLHVCGMCSRVCVCVHCALCI